MFLPLASLMHQCRLTTVCSSRVTAPMTMHRLLRRHASAQHSQKRKDKAGLIVKIDSNELSGTHHDEKASAEKIQCTLLATDVALSRGAPVMVIVPEAHNESISGDGVRKTFERSLVQPEMMNSIRTTAERHCELHERHRWVRRRASRRVPVAERMWPKRAFWPHGLEPQQW